MEAFALQHTAAPAALTGRSPLLRLQSDEKLIAITRRGNEYAFEALVQRYQPRLLAFCRHMLSSTEDAEDILQEVFVAAFKAMCADERPIHARPWLYRIARNRCLNHLRRPVPIGQDSMDVFERDNGASTADTVHRREEFRQILADVQQLPETQRTALLLREIDDLSYEQIAEAMDTTIPSVKSLLVRARVALGEASEARLLTCAEVRDELGEVAEGLKKTSAPVRRHLRTCDRCQAFKKELRSTGRALAAVYPIGPLVMLKQLLALKLGGGAVAGGAGAAGGSGVAGGSGIAGGAALAGGAAATGGAVSASGIVSAGLGTLAGKTAAGLAAAAIVTAGAVEVKHVTKRDPAPAAPAQSADGPPKPAAPAAAPAAATVPAAEAKKEKQKAAGEAKDDPDAEATPAAEPQPEPKPEEATVPPVTPIEDERTSSVTLPPGAQTDGQPSKAPRTASPQAPAEDGSGSSEPPPPSSPTEGNHGGVVAPL